MNDALETLRQIKALRKEKDSQNEPEKGELGVQTGAIGQYSTELASAPSQEAGINWRKKAEFTLSTFETDFARANKLFTDKKFLESFDLFERIAETYKNQEESVLSHLYDLYQNLPDNGARYYLYQQRLVDFSVTAQHKVLDIGSGRIPFPLATHLADLDLGDGNLGRAGIPFKTVAGKPVFACDIESTPFASKEFDIVYCSHVLEHVDSPERACAELQRIGKRGFIEVPTLGKDIFLNTAASSNHRWYILRFGNVLHFFEYEAEQLLGLRSDILMKMHLSPTSLKEKGLTALLYLKAEHFNTMLIWEDSFEIEVHRLPATKQITVDKPMPVRQEPTHTILFLNTYYKKFLESVYKANLELAGKPYQEQKQFLQAQCFGDSDFYSNGMHEAGWEADNLIVNCPQLQMQWAREHGYTAFKKEQLNEILLRQVQELAPDVVYIQDMVFFDNTLLQTLRQFAKLIVGQIATDFGSYPYFPLYDIVFTSFPHYVKLFRQHGITTYYHPLAFESRLTPQLSGLPKDRPVTFIGGISSLHLNNMQTLEYLAQSTPMEFYGYVNAELPVSSSILQKHHGELWGLEMFRMLARSRITFNRHGAIAGPYANNMRLFEATGAGALLITDYKDNLEDLFAIGKEIVAYRTPEEASALIHYYLAHPEEAEAIAQAGQRRTLEEHTYEKRMHVTAEILSRHLRYADFNKNDYKIEMNKISTGHTAIAETQINNALLSGWKDESIPLSQRILVQKELQDLYSGNVAKPFSVLSELLQPLLRNGDTLLETVCASGYYYEILTYLLSKNIRYTGVDYSESLINMAKEYYPEATFLVADGAQIPLLDNSFRFVVSSGILIHVPNYPEHIKESVRLSGEYVIFHRTTTCRKRPTSFLKKLAYGVETVEVLFNEDSIESEFLSAGLEILEKVVYYEDPAADIYNVSHLCRKKVPQPTTEVSQ
jgi:ubiquinone/menaquinone biosynthesis C-methylase UbiE